MYQSWIKLGKEKGITDLEVFAVRNKSLKLSVYQGKVDQHVQSDVEVVTIRGIVENKLSTIRFENLSTTNVSLMLDQLIANAKALTVVEPAIIYEGSKSYPKVADELFDFNSVPVLDKINLLKNLEAKILENSKVKQVQSTQYQEIDTKTTLVNSKGLNLSRHNTYAYAYAIGVFAEGEDIQTAYDVKLAKTFDEFDADKMAQTTIDMGVKKLGGKSMSSGKYPTVFSNEMFADLLSVFTSIFSGEAAYRNMTSLKDKVGKEIADPRFNLIDDPLLKDALFKMPFDDEGVACSKRHIIEKGVFKGFNHNLKTAAIFKEAPTGNGFHGSIAPTNLYLEPGQKSFDELISNIKEGVYITDLVGLHAGVKQVSGDFSLQASGFKIKDGKLDHAVKMIVISGNFFKAINEIDEIGSDLKFTIQGVGSPSILFKSLVVGGES